MNISTIKTFAFAAVVAATVPFAAYAQSTTDVAEDFSLFAAGSESAPSSAINDANSGYIPASYFHQSGWTGFGVHQADGACALINPDNYGAQLNSPTGYYTGAYIVKVRAKTLAANYRDNAQLTIGLWEESESQYNQTTYYEPYTTTKSEWREFTFEFNNTSYTSDKMLVAFSTNDKVLIDDVQISKSTALIAPQLTGVTNFAADGFTAHWQPSIGATHYLFSLFHKTKNSEATEQEFAEDFTSLKTTGTMPEGWTYTSQSGSAPEFFENTDNGIKGAVQFKNGDVITMPDNGGTLTALTFNIVECKMPKNADELNGAQIIVDLWNGFTWQNFTTIQIDADEYGYGDTHEIDWSRFVQKDQYKCTTMRFRLTGMPDDCAFGLAAFAWGTKNASSIVYDIKDKRVDGTSYTVSGLDAYTDYAYTVKACTETATSASSEAYDVIGCVAPVAEAATDVRHDSYTANWQLAPKATGYIVKNNDLYTAPSDEENFVVLNEDFSKISGSGVSIDQPYAFQNSKYEPIQTSMVYREGWQCYWGGYAEGCFVLTGLTDYNISGELVTPELSLNNDGGRYHVKVTARSMQKDETMIVYSKKTYAGQECQLSPDEWRTFELDFTGGELNDLIAFTSKNHYPFIVDDIKITQNLKQGDRVYEYLSTSDVVEEEETSYTVTNLAPCNANHTYAYRVYGVRDYNGKQVVSDGSDYVVVDGFTAINPTEHNSTMRETARYTIDGVKANANTRGVVIVKYADGSAKKQVR